MGVKEFYNKNYRKLLIVPALMFLLAVGQIVSQVVITGDFVNKGISLKGGSTLSAFTETEPLALQNYLQEEYPQIDLNVRRIGRGESAELVVETALENSALITQLRQSTATFLGIESKDVTIEITGSSIGASFFRQIFISMIVAFVLMALVVLIYFRTIVPSFAVVAAALSDIVVTLAIFNLTGVSLSTAGIAAFLMLIGYSVDTDILLTTRIIKRKQGTVFERLIGAMKTGLTMTVTTLIAVSVALFITNSDVVRQIMLILFIGLLVDLVNTWILNAAILRRYMENKHGIN